MPPPPHCATARRGRPEAYPKGRPHAPRTPRAAPVPPLATLRYGAARAAGGLPEGPPLLLPHCQKSDPTPPEIGTGVRSGPSPIAPESLAASREAGAKPPGLREPPVLLRGGFKRALTLG